MKKASFKINGLSCDAYSETAKDICFYSYNGAWAEDMKNPNGVNDVENFIGGHIRTDKASGSFNGAWAEDIDQEEIPRVKKPPPRRESGYFVKRKPRDRGVVKQGFADAQKREGKTRIAKEREKEKEQSRKWSRTKEKKGKRRKDPFTGSK